MPKVIKKCKKIITVSNYEKKRIDKVFSLQKDIVVPIYNGYSNHFSPKQNPQEITKKYINSENYIFVLGNTDPKKNSAGILKAYSEYLKDSNVKLPLLLADLSDDKLNDILKINNLEHIRSNIKLSGYIINSDLPYIYSGASMFVYASFRECFGIPILEAMACGTPVITSNTSAMPEIAGDGSILIDPFNIYSINDAMLQLENDTIFKDYIVYYVFERVKMFSWVNTAIDMLNLYNSI